METSKERYDKAMTDIRNSQVSDLPTDTEVDAVEKQVTQSKEQIPKKSHLTSEEKLLLSQLLKSHADEKIVDPVLLHLLKMRESSKKLYLEKQSEIKSIYMGIMKELNDLSQAALKLQGAIESTDRQIIEFLKDNQADGDSPPAA